MHVPDIATHELMLADIPHVSTITGSEYLNGLILTPQQLWDPPPSASAISYLKGNVVVMSTISCDAR